jgi:hypothetical protein
MLRVACALLSGMLTTAVVRAQPAQDTAAQLASRTASLLPRRATVSLELQNLSALPVSNWSSLRSLFEAELRKAGVEIMAGTAAEPRVRVTLSDSAHGLLLVAEVTSGDKRQVAMLAWNPPASTEENPRATLTKKFLWAQPEPILDLLLLDSDTQMLVLSASKVASFRRSGDTWTPSATASLVLPRPIPRDPRGRMEATPEGFRVFIPGATCTGSLQPDLKVTCMAGNEPWSDGQVRWVTDRNVLESDAAKAPFFTTADGLFGGAQGWGSDIAPIDDACSGSVAVITTAAGAEQENVRVFEVASGQAMSVSDALPLPGPVSALWPAETHGQVTLVVHNAQTGEYEASRLGLACSPQ